MNVYLRYLVYALLFVLYIYLRGKLQQEMFMQEEAVLKQHNFALVFLYRSLLDILLGFLIGAETLRQALTKKGKWGLNLPKLVGFCLPLLLIALLPTLEQFGYIPLQLIPAVIVMGSAPMIAAIALGYGLMTSLHKK